MESCYVADAKRLVTTRCRTVINQRMMATYTTALLIKLLRLRPSEHHRVVYLLKNIIHWTSADTIGQSRGLPTEAQRRRQGRPSVAPKAEDVRSRQGTARWTQLLNWIIASSCWILGLQISFFGDCNFYHTFITSVHSVVFARRLNARETLKNTFLYLFVITIVNISIGVIFKHNIATV